MFKISFSVLTRIIFILFANLVKAQEGFIEGKIIDQKDGSPLIGVTVRIVGEQLGAATDMDGFFKIQLPAKDAYTLSASYLGYQTKEIADVQVKVDETVLINISLEEAASTNIEETVVVKTTRNKESIASLISIQKTSPLIAQVIGAEAIRRSPDKNTGEVLKRISGTSLQDGKYLVVRGLSDRYNLAVLNGIPLSSTEPDRKTFSFDLIPSSIIDNMIVNKTAIPELPGEWAGGLVQVNTNDIPTSHFVNIQIGSGVNTQAVGNEFLTYKGGKTDFLGIESGARSLPTNFPSKTQFALISQDAKTNYGKEYVRSFDLEKAALPVNTSFQANAGFVKALKGNAELGGVVALTYNSGIRRTSYDNRFFNINAGQADISFDYQNEKYSHDILSGALANIGLKINDNHKITLKNTISVNSTKYIISRTGKDYEFDPSNGENIRANEMTFRQNMFYTSQLNGNHYIKPLDTKLNWYGSFSILDQNTPQQNRLQYNQEATNPNAPYIALIGATLSQKSGSFFRSHLSDYIYNAGGDISRPFKIGATKHTVKLGYLFQMRDRWYDARPFSVSLRRNNINLLTLPKETIFDKTNFGTEETSFSFNELVGSQYHYVGNILINAGFLQLDNNFLDDKLRLVWGARVENYDQLVGSTLKKASSYIVFDVLPSANLTYKMNEKTNIRMGVSQTVVRPEMRELSPFAYYDFEVGATILGNDRLKRTKITNYDLRYEFYPRSGELFTGALFYKNFKDPIELYFNQSGAGTSNTFNYLNVQNALSYGAEIEGRKKLDFINGMKNFTVQANVAYIYNRVKEANLNINRPMQGQSPYTVNVSLQYDLEKYGITSTLLYNQIGRRILYVGNDQVPAIWENPRPLVDFQLAKKILHNKAEIRLNVSDVLNQTAVFYHDLNENKKYDKNTDATAIKRKFGTNINISFNYSIK